MLQLLVSLEHKKVLDDALVRFDCNPSKNLRLLAIKERFGNGAEFIPQNV